MTTPARLAAPAVIAALLLPSPALGEQVPPGLALISIPGSQADRDGADQVGEQLARALAPAAVLRPAAAREKLLRAGGQEALRAAARKADEARRSLEAFVDIAGTAKLLREASEAHLDLLPLLGQIDVPVQLLVDLATVELALGHQQQVDEALQTAARLDPSFDLDPQEVSPRLARAARKARDGARDAPLLSEPRARRLGHKLGVDAIVVIQPQAGPQQVLVEQYRSASGARDRAWEVRGGDLSQVVAALGPPGASPRPLPASPAVDGDAGPAVVFSTTEPAQPRPRQPWYRRWWVWTIIGAAVAAGGATGVVLGLRSQQEPNADLTLEVHGHW